MGFRRRHILIDSKFQLRFSFFVCSWLFALSLIYPWVIYGLFEHVTRLLVPSPDPAQFAAIGQSRTQILWLLCLIQVFFIGITFLISLFVSHKISGPVYKVRSALEYFLENGRFGAPVSLRRFDHFDDLAETVNATVQRLRDGFDGNVHLISTVVARIEAALPHADQQGRENLEQALLELRKIQEKNSV